MLTIACTACGRRHRMVMNIKLPKTDTPAVALGPDASGGPVESHLDGLDLVDEAPISPEGKDEDRERAERLAIVAQGARVCACGSDRFGDLRVEDDPGRASSDTPPPPVLLIGPEGLPWYPRHRDIHFAARSDGRVAVVCTDLSWGIERPESEIEAVIKDHAVPFIHADEPLDGVLECRFRPMAKRPHYQSADDEAARLGLSEGGALAQAVRHALAERHREAPYRFTPADKEARGLDQASRIAFLWIDFTRSGWSTVHLTSGDFKVAECYEVRHRPSDHLHDEDDALRAFRFLAEDIREHGFEVFATDEVIDELRAAAALLGHDIGFAIASEHTMIHQTERRTKDRLAADGREIPAWLVHGLDRWHLGGDGDRLAGIREWRIAAGDTPARPVIFLDIDGALLPLRARVLGGNPEALERALVKRPRTLAEYPQAFDPVGIAMVNRLGTRSDGQFVISSNWLVGGEDKGRAALVQDLLIHNGLEPGRFHEHPTVPKKLRSNKAQEIAMWLDAHPMVHRWVTIEDDHWDDERCVPCSYEDGMTAEVYRAACHALGVEDTIMDVRRPRRLKRPQSSSLRWFF